MKNRYKEIIEINKNFQKTIALSNAESVSRETKNLGDKYILSLKNDLKTKNKTLWSDISKNYKNEIDVDTKMKIFMSEFDNEELFIAHETSDFIFNENCLKLNRNEMIVYYAEKNEESVLESLNKATRNGRSVYVIEKSSCKVKKANRGLSGYRKRFFNFFMKELNTEDLTILLNWFQKTTKIENNKSKQKPLHLLAKLIHNQKLKVRLGRYVEGLLEPNFNEWVEVSIHLERDSRKRVSVLALKEREWAEYSYNDYIEPTDKNKNGLFLTEDYYMEIAFIE